ncbi:MAG: hypothetical protein CV088_09765 [Nitrospira sp. LK70]|nr:hypothetical protein [Nitrospira sp. LK70]
MKTVNLPFSVSVAAAVLFASGCSMTMEQRWEGEQRWEAFDQRMQQEIGVKTEDYYVREWGKPLQKRQTPDGGEIATWEFRDYDDVQSWNQDLTFGPDGILTGFQRDHWPKEQG